MVSDFWTPLYVYCKVIYSWQGIEVSSAFVLNVLNTCGRLKFHPSLMRRNERRSWRNDKAGLSKYIVKVIYHRETDTAGGERSKF